MTVRTGTWKPAYGPGWGGISLRAVLAISGIALAFVGGLSAGRVPYLVPMAAVLPLVMLALAASGRHAVAPLFVVVGASAVGVLVFLPASAGDAGQRAGLESYGLFTAGATALAALMVVARRQDVVWIAPASAPLDRTMLVFAVLALVAGVVGAASGNSPAYLLGDVYRIMMLPAVYFVTVCCVRGKAQLRTVILLLAVALLLQHTRDAVYSAAELAAGNALRTKSVFWIQNLAGLVALATLAFDSPHLRQRWLFLSGAWLLLAVGISRGFRTYLLALAVVALVPLLLRPSTSGRFVRGWITAALVGAPLLAAAWFASPNVATSLSQVGESFTARFELATSGEDASASQRELEIDLVIDRLSSDRFALLAGTGAGSVYQLPYWASAYALEVYADDQGRLHNVHNSYGSMALRSGILGFAAIVALFATALWQARKLINRWPSTLAWFPFLVILGYTLASPFFFFVPGDVIFPVVAGLVAAYLRSETAPDQDAEAPPPAPNTAN